MKNFKADLSSFYPPKYVFGYGLMCWLHMWAICYRCQGAATKTFGIFYLFLYCIGVNTSDVSLLAVFSDTVGQNGSREKHRVNVPITQAIVSI